MSHSDSPTSFWCQLALCSETLVEMSDRLQAAYSDSALTDEDKIGDIAVGDVIAAQFDEDELFYRCLVLDVRADKVSVRFIDHGNCSLCSKEKAFKLKEEFHKSPIQAFQCSLDCISSLGDEWSQESCQRFSELVSDVELELKLVGRKRDGVSLVELSIPDNQVPVADILVNENLAKSSKLAGEEGKDASHMDMSEITEITEPIMESTVMVNDITNSMCDTTNYLQSPVDYHSEDGYT